jgi:hypothetical protein
VSDVVDLVARRDDRSGRTPLRCAHCGGEWFYLISSAGDNAGQVTLDADRRVTGYGGIFSCVDCGREA